MAESQRHILSMARERYDIGPGKYKYLTIMACSCGGFMWGSTNQISVAAHGVIHRMKVGAIPMMNDRAQLWDEARHLLNELDWRNIPIVKVSTSAV